MGPTKEPLGKKAPSPLAISLNELMELPLKLNPKLRKKISHRQEGGAENIEMAIIFLNSSSENGRRMARTVKPKPPGSNGIDMTFTRRSNESLEDAGLFVEKNFSISICPVFPFFHGL